LIGLLLNWRSNHWLSDYKSEFRDRILELLWRQWTTLGISGHGGRWSGAVIDPEALLLFSCNLARHDARLFDAILDWLRVNGRLINVQRLKRMAAQEGFIGLEVFPAIASITKTPELAMKWGRSAALPKLPAAPPQPLFYLKNGTPLPVIREKDPVFAAAGFLRDLYESRDVAQLFKPELPQNLILRLRALLGVNARCEILAFLLLNERGSPRSVARNCYFFPATVSKALSEMSGSGYVLSRSEGRHRYYQIFPNTWRDLLLGDSRPAWVVWGRLFSALEQIGLFLSQDNLADKSPLAQASALRRILKSVTERIEHSGITGLWGDPEAHVGESLIPFFLTQTSALLAKLESDNYPTNSGN
jgi:hypothetical protein